MAKANTIKIRMNSTGKTQAGKSTGYFKTTTKNPKSEGGQKKLEKKMFDPRAWNEETGRTGKHVAFKEGKVK